MLKVILVALNASYSHSSLALRYLEKNNKRYSPEIAEFSINDSIHSIYEKLLRSSADVYCFSCYVWNIEYTLKVAEMLSKAMPNVKIILGGPESGYNSREIIEKYPFVDVIIKGEGEISLGKILDDIVEKKELKPFIQSECFDLNFAVQPYNKKDIHDLDGKIIYFETSRGCPFNCTYCLSSAEHGVRFFPMDYVKEGLQLLFDERVPLVKLIDRTFNCNEKRALEIIDYIIKNSVCTKVHFEIEAQILTDNLITALNNAPKDIFQLEIGIQTINPKTMRSIRRKYDLEVTKNNILKLKRPQNMHIHLDLIAGLPYEDFDSFGHSFEYVYSMKPDMLQLGFLKVLHGTEIEDFGDDILAASFPPYEVISTSWISADELCHLKEIEEAVDIFYNSGKFTDTIALLELDERFISIFELFDFMGSILKQESKFGKFKQVRLYEIIYENFGSGYSEVLAIDFIRNNKTARLPYFLDRTVSKTFKKRYIELLNNSEFIEEHKITDELKDLRFENVLDKVFVMDYKNKLFYDITEYF